MASGFTIKRHRRIDLFNVRLHCNCTFGCLDLILRSLQRCQTLSNAANNINIKVTVEKMIKINLNKFVVVS